MCGGLSADKNRPRSPTAPEPQSFDGRVSMEKERRMSCPQCGTRSPGHAWASWLTPKVLRHGQGAELPIGRTTSQNHMSKGALAAALVVILLTGIACSRYKAGDCVQHTRDGFIWRITDAGLRGYEMQGWFPMRGTRGTWGLVVSAEDIPGFPGSAYVKVACPQSADTLREGR